MNLHSLTNTKGARKPRKRLGRGHGSGTGKTSGKGHKGQMSRSGHKHKLTFEGGQMPMVRRLPKRGFKNYTRKTYVPVNVSRLNCFEDGTEVTLDLLKQQGLANGPIDGARILGRGELEKKLNVSAQGFSATAREKIEAAGGSCTVVS